MFKLNQIKSYELHVNYRRWWRVRSRVDSSQPSSSSGKIWTVPDTRPDWVWIRIRWPPWRPDTFGTGDAASPSDPECGCRSNPLPAPSQSLWTWKIQTNFIIFRQKAPGVCVCVPGEFFTCRRLHFTVHSRHSRFLSPHGGHPPKSEAS